MPTIPLSGALWTLRKDGRTASAEIHVVESVGLELHYLRDGKILAWMRGRDVCNLLKQAAIERFQLGSC